MRDRRYADVERRARELIALHPHFGVLWKFLGVSLGLQGKEAKHALEVTADLLPDDAEAHFNLGNALRAAGRFDEAVKSYRRALEIKSDFAAAYCNLAGALRVLGQPVTAAASYRRALELEPDQPDAHGNLGNVLNDLGQLDEAVASYRRALEIDPDVAEVHNNLGTALLKLGLLNEAVGCFRRALELKRNFDLAQSNLGNALQDLGQLDEAVASYRRALELSPDFAAAHTNLGNALRRLGQIHEALASHRRALQIQPDFAQAHINLGNALRDLGQYDAAVASYRRAIQIEPLSALAHNNLGGALRELGRIDEAEASFRQALLVNPDYAEAHNNLAVVLRRQNRVAEAEASCRKACDIDPKLASAMVLSAELQADKGLFAEAEETFRRAIAVEPNSAAAWAGISSLRKMTASDAGWLTEAQRIASRRLAPRQEIVLRYAIGKYFDDMQDYEQAFMNYQRANELTKLCASKHDRRQVTQAVNLAADKYCAQWVSRMSRTRRDAIESARPVFIVGMPRSGTSLAEQILASHPAIFGAGELPFWSQAFSRYETTKLDADAGNGMIDRLGREYLDLLKDLSPVATRVIDKMPSNFLFLGLIHAALPNARILHMTRNPIDTCLSIYFQDFDEAHSYANDLEDLAHYYAEYSRLMRHWSASLPEHAIMEVAYEDLVADQEALSRKMLEFIGLRWDPQCIDFSRTPRTVVTRSRWQVRQKITNASVERWHNYKDFIGPLVALAETENSVA